MSLYNLLIVDDNPAILGALTQLLEGEADKVIGIKSPEFIPGIMETREIDLFIMDMNFRRGATDGKEGIAWLKRILQNDQDAVVIMITAFANLDVAIEALRDDVQDFFPKPVKIKELKASIKRALRKKAD